MASAGSVLSCPGRRCTTASRKRATRVELCLFDETFGKETVVVPVRFRDPKTRAQRLVVYVSDDAGATWSAAPAPASADLGAYFWGSRGVPFSAATARDWIVMLGPKLLVTRDAGRSWSVVHASYAPKASRIWDLNFASPTTGWAIFVTRTGDALVRTTDGGRDWSPLTP